MDKLDQLFIRACKSLNPTQRLLTLHKRFYFAYKEHPSAVARNKNVIVGILAELVDTHVPMTSTQMVLALQHTYLPSEPTLSTNDKLFEVLMYRIRHSKGCKFEGCTLRNYPLELEEK